MNPLEHHISHPPTMKDMLSSLPVEMIRAIADETDRHGILALRSTSRTMRAGCNDAFLRHFFTHRRHILSTHSLFALLSIASNPALRPQLQSVDLVLVHLRESDLPPEDLKFRKSRRHSRSRAQLLEVDRQKAVWSKWMKARDSFLHNDITLLSDSFRHLARAGIPLDISLTADLDAHSPHEVYGLNHLSRELGSTFARNPTPRSGEMFWEREDAATRLFSSFAGTELQLRKLSIPGHGITTSFQSFNLNNILLDGLGNSLSTLKSIDLSLHIDSLSGVDKFVRAIQCAAGLEDVKLQYRRGHESFSSHPWLTSAFCKARLKSITLSSSRIECHRLHELLQQHESTLQALKLVTITLTDDDDWAPLLEWIPKALSLKEIHVNDLAQWFDGKEQCSSRGFRIFGAEEIKEMMGGLVEGLDFGEVIY